MPKGTSITDYAMVGLIGVATIFFILTALASDANPAVALEENNYTTNNTPYTLANTPVNDYGCVLYHYENTTFPVPTDNYDCSNDNVTIYTNGTNVCYPNITANCNYYTSYSYQRSVTVHGIDFSFIMVLVAMGVSLYLGYSLIFAKKR